MLINKNQNLAKEVSYCQHQLGYSSLLDLCKKHPETTEAILFTSIFLLIFIMIYEITWCIPSIRLFRLRQFIESSNISLGPIRAVNEI